MKAIHKIQEKLRKSNTYCHHSVEMVNIDMDKYSVQSGQDLLTNGLRNKNRKSIRQMCFNPVPTGAPERI